MKFHQSWNVVCGPERQRRRLDCLSWLASSEFSFLLLFIFIFSCSSRAAYGAAFGAIFHHHRPGTLFFSPFCPRLLPHQRQPKWEERRRWWWRPKREHLKRRILITFFHSRRFYWPCLIFFFRMRPMNRKIPFNFNITESHRGDLSQKIRGHLIATRFFEKIFHWIFGVILIGRWWWAATGRDEWPETPRADAVPVVSSFSRWPLFAASRRQRKCWTWVSRTDSLVTLCLVQFFNFQWNFYVISLIFFF